MRILLCSDLHLGMKFAGYPDAQERLVEARFACLERIVAAANDARCDLLVIAGDLFERVSVARRDIQRAAAALRGFQGRLAAVLPGNHDYIAPDDELWPRFADACGDSRPRAGPAAALSPRTLRHGCLPLPRALHSQTLRRERDRLGARRAAGSRGAPSHRHRARERGGPFARHGRPLLSDGDAASSPGRGCISGCSATPTSLFPRPLTRVTRSSAPARPEPDGFDCRHEGSAWLLELDKDNSVSAKSVRTGALRFREESVEVSQASDLEKVARFAEDPEAARSVLRLHLRGRVAREVLASLGDLRARMAKSFLHLDLRSDELREELTREAIDRAYPAGSFPHSLLVRLAERGDQEALEAASELLAEMHG